MRLSGCLGTVSAPRRQVLVLRAGVGPARPLSRRAVADRLDVPAKRVARAERRGVRELRAAARAGACSAAPEAPAAAPAAGGSGGGSPGGTTLVSAEPIADDGRGATARSEVKDAYERGPAVAPATLLPPRAGDGDGQPLVLLALLAFAGGFAIVWGLQGRGGRRPGRVA